jgi:hypothetical protein
MNEHRLGFMDLQFKKYFEQKWHHYFGPIDLPITFYYTDRVKPELLAQSKNVTRCLIGNLKRVRAGWPFIYKRNSPGCLGGKRYSGFSQKLRPNFEYFLSCGIPDKLEGERYKKSPELVRRYLADRPPFKAPHRYLVFKRWDKLTDDDEPLAVVFFAPADVLSGLFTLANYDWPDPYAVITPMGAGCSSIINYALEESRRDRPRCILGLFDVSARPEVPSATLTFTVPMQKFRTMVENMDESFLTTASWKKVKKRI